MLPGIGGGEVVVIAVVALLVVGPKDLPKLLRQLGRFVGKMRSMADDFRSSFEDMARQSELDELRKEVEAMRNTRNSLPGLNDVSTSLTSLESDINQNFQASPTQPVEVQALEAPVMTPIEPAAEIVPDTQLASVEPGEPQIADPQIADPQMEGLPPQGARPAEPEPVVIKKARARKAPIVSASSDETAETPAPARKRSRAKSTVE